MPNDSCLKNWAGRALRSSFANLSGGQPPLPHAVPPDRPGSTTEGATMSQTRPEFEDRTGSLGIIFQNSGPKLDMTIADGDTVTLKLGDVSVIVIDIKAIGTGSYQGTIDGFEMHPGTEYKGYRIGDSVTFPERK